MATIIRRPYRAKDGTKKVSAKWYGQYVDALGIARRKPLSANKTAAQQMLNALVQRV